MLKKLQNLLFEDDDEFVEDNTEAEQVSASAPVTPTVQPQVTPVEETAQIPVQPEPVSEIPPVPTTPVEPEPQPVVPEEGLPKTGEDQMNVPMTALTVGMMAAAYVLMTGRKKTEE